MAVTYPWSSRSRKTGAQKSSLKRQAHRARQQQRLELKANRAFGLAQGSVNQHLVMRSKRAKVPKEVGTLGLHTGTDDLLAAGSFQNEDSTISSDEDMEVDAGEQVEDLVDASAISLRSTMQLEPLSSIKDDGTGSRSEGDLIVNTNVCARAAIATITTSSVNDDLRDDVSEASTIIFLDDEDEVVMEVDRKEDPDADKENKKPLLLLDLPTEILIDIFSKAVGVGGDVIIETTEGDEVNVPNRFAIADHSFGGEYVTSYMTLRCTNKKIRDIVDESFWRLNGFQFGTGYVMCDFLDRTEPKFVHEIRRVTINVVDGSSEFLLHYLLLLSSLRRLTITGCSYVYEAGDSQDQFEAQCQSLFEDLVQGRTEKLFTPLREAYGQNRFEIVFDALCKGRNVRFHDLMRRAQLCGKAAGQVPLSLKQIEDRAAAINRRCNNMIANIEAASEAEGAAEE